MKRGTLLIIFGVFLLISGITLLSYFRFQEKKQMAAAAELEKQFETNEDKMIPSAHQVPNSQEVKELPGAVDVDQMDEADEIDQSDAIGVLRIDKMNSVLQIFDNASNQALLDGVGLVETTDFPSSENNTISVIAGHRGSARGLTYFLDIEKLEIGDEIKVTTPDEILYYEVVEEEVIEPTDWSKFIREEDKSKLFLMTCHPYPKNNKRLLVKSELVESTQRD